MRKTVTRRPVAVQGLTGGLGIEILQIDDKRVTWRWSDGGKERTSRLDGTGEAFRTGRVWRRLADFERVR